MYYINFTLLRVFTAIFVMAYIVKGVFKTNLTKCFLCYQTMNTVEMQNKMACFNSKQFVKGYGHDLDKFNLSRKYIIAG